MFDFLVVGAGFAGSVIAERLASSGQRVLIIDRRSHIGGNAYDCINQDGLLIHVYGPHIFHTNSEQVVAYLSRFTDWHPYEHRVLSSVDGKLFPIPINIDTVNRYFQVDLDAAGVVSLLSQLAETPEHIRTSEEAIVSRVGRELYNQFFKNYTRKQWGCDASELDASVAMRVPFRLNHDDRYFTDRYQMMPSYGYTKMFERMLHHPLIEIRLDFDFRDVSPRALCKCVVFTGPIDEYFEFQNGKLPYRSLRFVHETYSRETFQSAGVINYPNEHDYTRVTEFKYLTGQHHVKTSVVYEYPCSIGDPYYPVPCQESAIIFERYKRLAMQMKEVYFLGRLANYRYLNMDQVVAQALKLFKKIACDYGIPIGTYSNLTERR